MLSHPEPAAAKLDYLLEFNGPYDEALKEKTKGMAPMVLIRRALPELLPPSADRSLSGVRLDSAPAVTAVVPRGPGAGKGKGKDDDAKGKGKGKLPDDEIPPPGSLKGIVKWVDKTHMQLGSLNYDTAKIGKHYSLDEDHCYPVLLSIKKGGAALALCPHWGEPGHTSLASEKHVTPKEWNYTHVCAHMAEKRDGATRDRKRKRGA
jgi:hypothetical protein